MDQAVTPTPEPRRIGRSGERDDSPQENTFPEKQWEALRDQRNQMIRFMTGIFGWLNGAIVVIVLIGMFCDQWNLSYQADSFDNANRFISSGVLTALIAATVAQAGLAFITITKFLFPGQKDS